jgi:hypothetical protein
MDAIIPDIEKLVSVSPSDMVIRLFRYWLEKRGNR